MATVNRREIVHKAWANLRLKLYTGHLAGHVVATRIQADWSSSRYCTSAAEVRLAAALAATGHLTSVENMKLYNLELPSSEDMPSLARVVRGGVKLSNVTGDLGPLLSSLTCRELMILNMYLDQEATSSLVAYFLGV